MLLGGTGRPPASCVEATPPPCPKVMPERQADADPQGDTSEARRPAVQTEGSREGKGAVGQEGVCASGPGLRLLRTRAWRRKSPRASSDLEPHARSLHAAPKSSPGLPLAITRRAAAYHCAPAGAHPSVAPAWTPRK